jgi:hypothetical protein
VARAAGETERLRHRLHLGFEFRNGQAAQNLDRGRIDHADRWMAGILSRRSSCPDQHTHYEHDDVAHGGYSNLVAAD